MEMTKGQRLLFASRLGDVRRKRFGGSRRAAYNYAGVNAATWARAEGGETIKERSLVTIVKALWPETDGDWQRLNPPISDPVFIEDDMADHLRSVGAEDAADELDRLRATGMLDAFNRISALEERVERLEEATGVDLERADIAARRSTKHPPRGPRSED